MVVSSDMSDGMSARVHQSVSVVVGVVMVVGVSGVVGVVAVTAVVVGALILQFCILLGYGTVVVGVF